MSSDDPYAAILAEARAAVAAGQDPDATALEARIRSAGGAGAAEQRALSQLARVLSVHRARSRVAHEPEAPAAARGPRPATGRGPRRALIRPRATITGNMEVRRAGAAPAPELVWDAATGVTEWEVRVSERPDPRRDYVVRETTSLPGAATGYVLALGEHPLRVHLLGRARDGRLVRRAIISALTAETWNDRWERRATAS